jgi:PAS domain S-box-containing protein
MHSLEGIQLRTLITQTDVGIAACNREGRLTMLSPGLERLLGLEFRPFAEDQLVEGFDLYDAAGERRLSPEEIPLMRARHGETVRDAVICARDSRGGLVHLRCNAAPVYDDAGVLRGAIVLVQDVSAEWAAVRQQHELRDRAGGGHRRRPRRPGGRGAAGQRGGLRAVRQPGVRRGRGRPRLGAGRGGRRG